MLARIMKTQATTNIEMDSDRLSTLVGRYFQIKNDYDNLSSNDVGNVLHSSQSTVALSADKSYSTRSKKASAKT